MKIYIKEYTYECEDGAKIFYKKLPPIVIDEIMLKYGEFRPAKKQKKIKNDLIAETDIATVNPEKMPAMARDVVLESGGIIGWEGVTDEDGNIVEFNKKLIKHLPMEIIYALATKMMSTRKLSEEEQQESTKNVEGNQSKP